MQRAILSEAEKEREGGPTNKLEKVIASEASKHAGRVTTGLFQQAISISYWSQQIILH